MPAYGRCFSMGSASVKESGNCFLGRVRIIFESNNLPFNKPGAAASGSFPAGAFTGEDGFMAYYEICDKINNNGWTEVRGVF